MICLHITHKINLPYPVDVGTGRRPQRQNPPRQAYSYVVRPAGGGQITRGVYTGMHRLPKNSGESRSTTLINIDPNPEGHWQGGR
eukprot:3229152-Pyramimonas_sp.AAC.1